MDWTNYHSRRALSKRRVESRHSHGPSAVYRSLRHAVHAQPCWIESDQLEGEFR
jgi:hypothetical protein